MKSTAEDYTTHLDRDGLAATVGSSVVIRTAALSGKRIKALILCARGWAIEIGRSGDENLLRSLSDRQEVLVSLIYRGARVTVQGLYRQAPEGRRLIELNETASRESQRRFYRLPTRLPVKLAALPSHSTSENDLRKLRWLATDSRNLSSGGIMLNVPVKLLEDVLILVHVEVKNLDLPPLLLGKVRHCHQVEQSGYHVGVEFITADLIDRIVSPDRLTGLPAVIKGYTIDLRERIDSVLRESKGKLQLKHTGV